MAYLALAGLFLSFGFTEAFQSFKKVPTHRILSVLQGKDSLIFLQSKKDGGPEEFIFRIDDEDVDEPRSSVTVKGKTEKDSPRLTTRWSSLNPQVKKRIIEEAQQRAIRNKQRREPTADKKRREFEIMQRTLF